MCYFITLVVPGADEASIALVLTRHGRRATPISNPSVASILQPGEVQFLTTVGHCDCATVLMGRSSTQVRPIAKRAAARRESCRSRARQRTARYRGTPPHARPW